jgi:hypothetical protein
VRKFLSLALLVFSRMLVLESCDADKTHLFINCFFSVRTVQYVLSMTAETRMCRSSKLLHVRYTDNVLFSPDYVLKALLES